MVRFFILWAVLLGTAQAQGLPKLVSLNMCADPYLMGFARREQILALTPQSRDPALSPFAQEAMGFPTSNGSVEAIVNHKPDLVITSAYGQGLKRRLLEAQGIATLTLRASQNYAEARVEIMRLGRAIGRVDAARAYLARLDAALVAVERPLAVRILPLQRRGLTVGAAHILGDIIRLSGGRIAGGFEGHIRPLRLEEAVASQADFLLTTHSALGGAPADRGSAFLAHPSLAMRFAPSQRLYLPDRLVTCAGAATPLAVRALYLALK